MSIIFEGAELLTVMAMDYPVENRAVKLAMGATETAVGAIWFAYSGKKFLDLLNGKPLEGKKEASFIDKIWLGVQVVAAAGLTVAGLHTAKLALNPPSPVAPAL